MSTSFQKSCDGASDCRGDRDGRREWSGEEGWSLAIPPLMHPFPLQNPLPPAVYATYDDVTSNMWLDIVCEDADTVMRREGVR